MDRQEIKDINQEIVQKVYDKYSIEYPKNIKLVKKGKFFLTVNENKPLKECFLRFYVNENIDVYIRFYNMHKNEYKNFTIFTYSLNDIKDIDLHKKQFESYLDYMVYAALNTSYCPEPHAFMKPINYSKELDGFSYEAWENRMLEEITLNTKSFQDWYDRCIYNCPKEFQCIDHDKFLKFIIYIF